MARDSGSLQETPGPLLAVPLAWRLFSHLSLGSQQSKLLFASLQVILAGQEVPAARSDLGIPSLF